MGTVAPDLFDGTEESGEEAEGEALPLEVRDASPEYLATGPDERQQSRTRAQTRARRAAQVAGLVKKPRGRDTPERGLAFESRLGAKTKQLVARVVLPGEWYLVRWGGTRKGSGSFYTRPGLAVPTVQRTLRPLACDSPAGPDGTPDPDAPAARWTPKLPEQILALTVCDPACGSGTFPLAALRFLTEALYASLQHHGRIEPDGERALVRLLGIEGGGVIGEGAGAESGSGEEGEGSGVASELRLGDELIPCPPDDERFEPRLEAVLRRHVVERHRLDYRAQFRAQSNFVGYVASPFGDPEENDKGQDRFAAARGNENRSVENEWHHGRRPWSRADSISLIATDGRPARARFMRAMIVPVPSRVPSSIPTSRATGTPHRVIVMDSPCSANCSNSGRRVLASNEPTVCMTFPNRTNGPVR